jgi:hypothetical protein
MNNKCFGCIYNRENQNELGNGCGNDFCTQEAMLFDCYDEELEKSKHMQYLNRLGEELRADIDKGLKEIRSRRFKNGTNTKRKSQNNRHAL